MCDPGSFVWIKFIEIGVSGNYANDGNGGITCPREDRIDCNKYTEPEKYYWVISFRRAYEITVPDETVVCNGEETPANYMHITFACIERKLHGYQFLFGWTVKMYHMTLPPMAIQVILDYLHV